MKWSEFQKPIFDFVKNGEGNGIVEAVAGSGKTTTIVECFNNLNTDDNVFLAFNKKIATELKNRGVNARTFHSLGYGACINRIKDGVKCLPSPQGKSKTYEICKNNLSKTDLYLYYPTVNKMVGLAKNIGVGCLIPNTVNTWYAITDRHDIYLDSSDANMDTAIKIARQTLDLSNESPFFDFDDMLYWTVMFNLKLRKYDFVFVDEAQDTNCIQREMLTKMLRHNSRMIAVGDPAQSIYAFRGASSNSMDLISEQFECETFPLSVSYRCGNKIVEHARNWVSHIQAAPDAQDGIVDNIKSDWDCTIFKNVSNSMVVCRTTEPLVRLAYKLIKTSIPCYIVGKEFGGALKKLVKNMKADSLAELSVNLDEWCKIECEKALERDNESKAAIIREKVNTIGFLIKNLDVDERTIDGLNDWLDLLFSDRENALPLSTIHKAKGLEADVVYWLNGNAPMVKYARKDWQIQQEYNLKYVATTRAKNKLVILDI